MPENSTILDIVILLVGGIFLVRRVAEMERFFNLRVVFLTAILACIGLFFWLYLISLFTAPFDDCLTFTGNASEFY